jgi:transcriptional regulator with XRE-family HTH domain
MQLRLERTAARLTVIELAAQMGVHRNTLAAIEKSPLVKPEQAAAVRDAIARLSRAVA